MNKYELRIKWNDYSAEYEYVLYEDTEEGRIWRASGNINWAKRNAKHYKIDIPALPIDEQDVNIFNKNFYEEMLAENPDEKAWLDENVRGKEQELRDRAMDLAKFSAYPSSKKIEVKDGQEKQ